MKQMTLTEFEALVTLTPWRHEQSHEVTDQMETPREIWGDDGDYAEQVFMGFSFGWATIISTLDGININYTEGFSYDDYEPDTLSTDTDGISDVWSIDGVVVTDEDGEQLNAYDLADYLPLSFSEIDYSVLEIEKITDIDVDEESDMETFTLEIDNQPNIRFTGELIASASSTDNQAVGSSYSGQTGRWTELALYKTQGGKYICHQVGRTRWQGEQDRFSGAVCENTEEVIEFFGHRWLAKELYEYAGICDAINVE